jgi:hypothetical protein
MQSSSRGVGILVLTCAVLSGMAIAQDPSDLPEAFEQIIPRGRIESIDDPEFVGATEAELPDDAWVLGVAGRGAAKAYSLNLLNRHEIVNDRIGDLPVAAVW